jgi:hypothetical protein
MANLIDELLHAFCERESNPEEGIKAEGRYYECEEVVVEEGRKKERQTRGKDGEKGKKGNMRNKMKKWSDGGIQRTDR